MLDEYTGVHPHSEPFILYYSLVNIGSTNYYYLCELEVNISKCLKNYLLESKKKNIIIAYK